MDSTSLVQIAAAAGTAAVCAHGCSARGRARGNARLAHTATALGVSAASISPVPTCSRNTQFSMYQAGRNHRLMSELIYLPEQVLSGTDDAIAEKLTEDAKDILVASLNAADPRVGINQAV